MQILALVLALVVPPSPAATADHPCFRPIGGVHEAVPLGIRSEGLDFQTDCLIWEYDVKPKGEFLPPRSIAMIGKVGLMKIEERTADPFADAFSRSLILKPADGTDALGLPTSRPKPR
jgi:hypothetical protein